MKIVSTLAFGGVGTGELSFTGTAFTAEATNSPVQIGDDKDQYFVGQIENISAIECQVMLKGYDGLDQRFRLRPSEALRVRGFPLDSVKVFVNGTVTLRGIGRLIEPETPEDKNSLIQTSNIIERAPSQSSTFNFPTYDHTDITTATTTTIATPASGLSIRVYKITVSTQGAARPIIQWTDSDGTSNVNIIGTLNFSDEGTFVYDFGDEGLVIPNGADGLLRLVSNNVAVLDVDVISEDV